MRRIRLLPLFMVITITVLLAACGDASAPASPTPLVAPTTTTIATIATVPMATSAQIADTDTARPDDTTQARLRLTQCVYDEPNMDVYVNGQVAVNGGAPQTELPAGRTTGYLYLEPGTYSVALVPTGKGADQAFLGPLDVSLASGHRYTVVALGQASDAQHKALVINETEAFQAVGASSTDAAHITVNNLKGVPAIDFKFDGKAYEKDVPYGGFKAAVWPAGSTRDLVVEVSGDPGKRIDSLGGALFNDPGVDFLDCWGGTYPGTIGNDYNSLSSYATSALNLVDFMQGVTDAHAKDSTPYQSHSYSSFLAGLKSGGLPDTLASGGPYLVFAPTDAGFKTLPKTKLDELTSDPKAMADVVRTHIVEGYHPYGGLGPGPRTFTNLLGEELVYTSGDSGVVINTQNLGDLSTTIVANGTRVFTIDNVLLPPTTKPTPAGTVIP